MGSIKGLFPLLFLFVLFPLCAQNGADKPGPAAAVSLAAGISRLENTASAAQTIPERRDAFINLIRLYRLSGDTEAALKACDGALALSPGDGRLVLEQARLLLSQGEYEKAGTALRSLSDTGQDSGLLMQAQYLGALLDAFGSSNIQPLTALAENPDFAGYRGGIYYTLWKLTGLSSWKLRLTAELPQSPEAKIAAASAAVNFAPTPLWLLYPGRDSITPAAPMLSQPLQQSALPQSAAPDGGASGAPSGATASPVSALQTGLFSREENARAMAERLKNAGFEPFIVNKMRNGNQSWTVCVPYANDMNTVIQKLKNAGFESFPVKL